MDAVGTSDLSTIMEAETSGISKHLPSLDESSVQTFRSTDSRISANTVLQCLPTQDLDAQDTSVLDLSTENISKEVLAALSANERQEGWLTGVVVEDADSPSSNGMVVDSNTTFNLSALDSDLAALLRPHRAKDRESALQAAIDVLSP